MIASIRAGIAAAALSAAVLSMPVQASGLVKQAKKIERKLPAQTRDAAFTEALLALEQEDDPKAVANLAASLGITVAELEGRATALFSAGEGSARNGRAILSRAPVQAQATQGTQPGRAQDHTYNRFGYDASFDAPNTDEQQTQLDMVKAEQLYRYALTIRHMGQRKAILAEAAALGSTDAEYELNFY